MMEPPVWLPTASGTMPAATAAAEPLEEPPGVWPGWCGLRVLPGVRVANSVVTVLPMMTAPAARRRSVTAASRDGVRRAGLRQGVIRVEEGPRQHVGLHAGHALEAGRDQLARLDRPRPDQPGRLGRRQPPELRGVHG